MRNGTLVISLDFELLWGVFDKVNWREKKEYFKNTRKLIPEILQLFEKYEISCTWATVGMLFNENWKEWNASFPRILPMYQNQNLSAFQYGKEIQCAENWELCFAPDLIKNIRDSSNQELATHTYSHFYCLEKGQNVSSFEADLQQSITKAKLIGVELKSLVFPRNQFNDDYLEVCKKLGIKNVRSNPLNWYWKDTERDKFINKLFRTGDAYLGSNDKSYTLSNQNISVGGVLSQPSSRLFRPYSPNKILNSLKLKRIKDEMEYAARAGEYYHLWWHPHNFGNFPQENLKDLEEILKHFQLLKEKLDFTSSNMEQVGDCYSV